MPLPAPVTSAKRPFDSIRSFPSFPATLVLWILLDIMVRKKLLTRAVGCAPGALNGSVSPSDQRPLGDRRFVGSESTAALRPAGRPRITRPEIRMRTGAMRRLHRLDRRTSRALVHRARQQGGRTFHHDARRFRDSRKAESPAGCLHRRTGRAVRLLHERHDHDRPGIARQESEAHRRSRSSRPSRVAFAAVAPTPGSSARCSARRAHRRNAMNANLSRRDILRGGSALLIGFAWSPLARRAGAAEPNRSGGPIRRANRSMAPRSIASSRFNPTARQPSSPAKSIWAPACESRCARWPPRSSDCRSRKSIWSKATRCSRRTRAERAAVPD